MFLNLKIMYKVSKFKTLSSSLEMPRMQDFAPFISQVEISRFSDVRIYLHSNFQNTSPIWPRKNDQSTQ